MELLYANNLYYLFRISSFNIIQKCPIKYFSPNPFKPKNLIWVHLKQEYMYLTNLQQMCFQLWLQILGSWVPAKLGWKLTFSVVTGLVLNQSNNKVSMDGLVIAEVLDP